MGKFFAGCNAFIDGVQKGAIIVGGLALVAIAAKYCSEEN